MNKINDVQQAELVLNNTKGIANITVSSISGGKTSAYMAYKFPTDVNLFSLVLSEDPLTKFKDSGLTKRVQERIPHFIGTRELENTIRSVFELEQLIGKEIKFVASQKTFEQLIKEKRHLPNRRMRYCTQEMKIRPIFEYCYQNLLDVNTQKDSFVISNPIEMNIGFRWDESYRVFKSLGATYNEREKSLDWSKSGGCEPIDFKYKCDIVGKYKGKHRILKTADWRFKQFPLWTNRVTKEDVVRFWINKSNFDFPKVSNCDYCFFHRGGEMLDQLRQHPERAIWWLQYEHDTKFTFGNKPLTEIFNNQISKSNLENAEQEQSCSCTD